MLDPSAGEVILATTGVRLGPAMTRTEFLASPIGAQAAPGTINPPWASYGTVLGAGEVGPFPADVTVQFQDEALVWVTIINLSEEFGTDWDNWSREKEDARRLAHTEWLRSSGLPPGQYPFGEVWSDYSEKDALSKMVIQYTGAAGRPWREGLLAWAGRAGWGRREVRDPHPKKLADEAFTLAERHHAGQLLREAALVELARRCPGYSRAEYERAFGQALFESR